MFAPLLRCGLLALAILSLPQAAISQSVRVTSGEHDGFSRIVLQYPVATGWRLWRTATGYALATEGPQPRYDLTDVFRLIPRDRLAAIFADPADGRLQLGIGCACHILPFELRPGLVVLDIRDGPAPEGSSFEETEQGAQAPPLSARNRPPGRPAERPTRPLAPALAAPSPRQADAPGPDRAEWRRDAARAARLPPRPQDLPLPSAEQEQTRADILRELARGAAEGVVDMAGTLADTAGRDPGGVIDSHIRIGAAEDPRPGLDPSAARRPPGMLTADGRDCFADDRLDLSGWGAADPVATTVGALRGGLLGEFDEPDPEAAARAIRYHLHLGFGAEAQALIGAFVTAHPDRDLWRSLAALVDGEIPRPDAFRGMEVCDSAASLWAVLGSGEAARDPATDRAAVQRGFSALPLHLRHHLGPPLAEKLRLAGDVSGAAAIRDAILRAPGDPGPEVRLMEAELQLAAMPETPTEEVAAPLLEPIIAGSGPSAIAATVALIEAEIAAGRSVSDSLSTTAAAFLHEAGNSERAGTLASALALALASQSRLREGLALSPLAPGTTQRAWAVFATMAQPDAFLETVVGWPAADRAALPADTRLTIARRLDEAGLHAPALDWLDGIDTPEARLLRAGIHGALRDWRAALRDLAGLDMEAALILRARALAALGDPAALPLLAGPDRDKDRHEAARRLELWPLLADLPQNDPWARAASLVLPEGEITPPPGPACAGG